MDEIKALQKRIKELTRKQKITELTAQVKELEEKTNPKILTPKKQTVAQKIFGKRRNEEEVLKKLMFG